MTDSERLDDLEEFVQQIAAAVMGLERFVYDAARRCPCPACVARRNAEKAKEEDKPPSLH